VKNLKLEIKYLKNLKKIILENCDKYFNRGISYEEDSKFLDEAIKERDFDNQNIFRVLIEEKKVKLFY